MKKINFQIMIEEMKKYKMSFISTFVIGLITYLPVAMYLSYNNDILAIAENKNVYGHYIFTTGRFVRALFEWISNHVLLNITVPVFQVVIGLLIFSICVALIAYILKINNKISQLLLGGIIVLSCYSEMFFFVHDIIAYTFSIFFALIALIPVANTLNEKSSKSFNYIVAFAIVLILLVSIGIYQISIIYFLSIYFLLIVQKIYEKTSYKIIIKSLMFTFIICFLVAIIYLFLVKITHSNALSVRGGIHGINKLLKIYGSIVLMPIKTYAGINYSIIVKIVIALIYIVIFVNFIYIWLRAEIFNKIILILLVISFPIVINLAMLLEDDTSFRTLHGMIFIIVLPLWLANNVKILIKWGKLIYISLVIIIFFNFYYAECRILAEKNACESTKAYLIEMVSKIKSLDNYNPNDKVALMSQSGAFKMENFIDYHSYSLYFNSITYSCLRLSWGIEEAFKVFAGYNIKLVSQEEKERIKENKEYNDMNTYPYYNSIKIINDVIVIKLE